MSNLKIDKRLNLVVELERTDGVTVYVYSVPVPRLVYEANYSLIHKVMSSLYADEFSPVGASRVASLRMKEIAEKEPERFGKSAEALLAEIVRLTVIWQPGANGWEQVAFADAMKGDKSISEEDIAEVENILCFFTAASWFHNRREREELYRVLDRLGVQTTSSPATAYLASLQTSKQSDSIGEKVTA